MDENQIETIKREFNLFKTYSEYQAENINTLNVRVRELENKVNALEKLTDSIMDLDWTTVKFRDRSI
jgi:hypothetical protein